MRNLLIKQIIILMCFAFFAISCTSPKVKQANIKNIADQSKNPFSFDKTGLPHQTYFCGVGAPDRISADLAENVIGKVFKDNKFKLTKNYLYEKDGSSFILNGYDKKNKIGYVYLDYNNLEDDGIIPWDEYSFAMFYESFQYQNKTSFKTEEEKELRALRKWLSYQEADKIKRLINYMNRNLLAFEKTLVAKVKNSNNEKFLRGAYSKLYQKQKKYTLSLYEVKKTIENTGKDGVFIAVISVFDKSLAVYKNFDIEPDQENKKDKYTQEDALNYLRKNVKAFIKWSGS